MDGGYPGGSKLYISQPIQGGSISSRLSATSSYRRSHTRIFLTRIYHISRSKTSIQHEVRLPTMRVNGSHLPARRRLVLRAQLRTRLVRRQDVPTRRNPMPRLPKNLEGGSSALHAPLNGRRRRIHGTHEVSPHPRHIAHTNHLPSPPYTTHSQTSLSLPSHARFQTFT